MPYMDAGRACVAMTASYRAVTADVERLDGHVLSALEPHGVPAPTRGIPAPAAVPDKLAFFEQLRTWMQAFPPSEPDQAYQRRFAPLGLLDAASPYADCPPELSQVLTAGAEAAKQLMETTLKKGGLAPVVNGWTLTFHMFDYNLDHLGLGTIDDPA